MITNLVRNIVQFGGTSTFEKARLSATYKGDYQHPNESDIEAIMLTLSGKDPDTRPQIGYTTIIGKLETSQSKVYWNYIIKNLIILDRCLEQRYFVSDIADMNVKYVENYVEQDTKFKNMSIDSYIRKYYLLIKKKAALYSIKKSSYNTPREEKKNYFKQQTEQQIFDEFNQGQLLFDQILDVSVYCKQITIHDKLGLLKYRVNQYVYQLLLFTMLNLYYNSYILIVVLLERLLKLPIPVVKKFKDLYNQFLKNNENLINFINSRLFIKGFSEINTCDIAKIDTRIIGAIEEYIRIAERSEISKNLSEDIQLAPELIEEQLIFAAIDAIRQSIHQRDGHQDEPHRPEQHKLSTMITAQKIQTFESKLKEFGVKNPTQIDLNCFNTYKQQIFWEFFNNYSTEYQKIDCKLFKTLSVPNDRESSQPKTSTENNEAHEETVSIIFIKPEVDFDTKIFESFANITCFQVPKLLDNIDEFPDAEEDDFPDYEDD